MCVIERDGKVVIIDQATRITELETQIDLLQNEIFELRKGTDSQKVISELMAQVAALKEIAEEERACRLSSPDTGAIPTVEHYNALDPEGSILEARRQLSEEHPEAFQP